MNPNQTKKIIVFAGTNEGRILCEFLANDRNRQVDSLLMKYNRSVTACVATEYGSLCLDTIPDLIIKEGRLSKQEIEDTIADYDYIVDATHPYAQIISRNLKEASMILKKSYIRIVRPTSEYDNVIECETITEACEYLNQVVGNVLLTTGSKELLPYTKITNYADRLFARILPSLQSLEECIKHGFRPSNIICMQGPFCEEMNIAMLKQTNARYLVTKETGKSGGFDEKLSAAAKCMVEVIVIGRPKKEEGLSLEQTCQFFKEELGILET